MEELVLGKTTRFPIENKMGINAHVCVFGGSGSGKSHSIVRPNILNFSSAGSSMIISDPKGSLEKEFKDYLKTKGYKIYSINLIEPEKSSCTYNPFDYISKEIDFIKLAHRIIYSDSLSRTCKNQDPYWNRMAEALLAGLLELTMCVEKEGDETLDRVIYYISHLSANGLGETNDILDNFAEKRKDSLVAKNWIKIKSVMPAEKTFSCIVSSVQEHLARYESEEMTKFFNKSEKICFEDFAKEKSVLFLKISDTDDTYYDFANIIYGQAIDSISRYADRNIDGKCRIPVRFILDDFASNVWIDSFPKIISTSRARNISFMIICQSVQQLRMGYQDDAQTIISNSDNLVFMGTNDVETAREFSIRLDIPVYDVLTQKRGDIYIFRAGEKPIEDERYDYREHELYDLLKKNAKDEREEC